MTKLDLVKKYKRYYSSTTKIDVVEFGNINYLSIVGQGEPAGELFTKVLESLYPLAYGIKKICKQEGQDFAVPKLEGLWWVESDRPALEVDREEWYWKLLIRMPDFVTKDMVNNAKDAVYKSKKINLIKEINFETINESVCIQVLHKGSYSTEPDTIKLMHEYMLHNGYVENGLHHEIYLSDPRKTAPEKMKTILRQPVKR